MGHKQVTTYAERPAVGSEQLTESLFKPIICAVIELPGALFSLF